MRTFNSIGKGTCLICGTGKKGKVMLVIIDGTQDGNIAEAKPIHVGCIDRLRVNREMGVIYMKIGKP